MEKKEGVKYILRIDVMYWLQRNRIFVDERIIHFFATAAGNVIVKGK